LAGLLTRWPSSLTLEPKDNLGFDESIDTDEIKMITYWSANVGFSNTTWSPREFKSVPSDNCANATCFCFLTDFIHPWTATSGPLNSAFTEFKAVSRTWRIVRGKEILFWVREVAKRLDWPCMQSLNPVCIWSRSR
jgi:hypothetical protein